MGNGPQLSFSIDEYRSRVAKVQRSMSGANLDVLLVHDFADICYLTGIQSMMGPAKYFMVIVPAKGDPCLVAQDFELYNADLTCWVTDQVTFKVFTDPVLASCQALHARGFANQRIGIQPGMRCLTPSEYEALKKSLADAHWVDASSLVRSVRAVKSPAEIDYIRQAAKITSAAMKSAMEMAVEGNTDNDIAAAAAQTCFTRGSEFLCMEPIVSLGRRSGVPHSTFSRNPIRRGDLCFVEIGACFHRYSAPLIRTFSMGEPGLVERRVCSEIEAALNAVLDSLRPGIPASQVAMEAEPAWQWTYSNPELFWNYAYGYSVGLGFPPDWNDAPIFIRKEDQTILQPGMIFHCTNNVRKGGVFGMGISETVVITDTGCEVLTEFPRRLVIK